jgi:hypothetical protein
MAKRKSKLPKETIEAVADGLREISDGFYFHEHESGTEGDSDDYFYEVSYTEPEDVELAVAEFASELLKKKLITKKGSKAPSFSDVFEQVFGPDHDLTAKAQYFEGLVSEYEGYVSLEDMRAAKQVIDSMISTLSGDVKKGDDQGGKLF